MTAIEKFYKKIINKKSIRYFEITTLVVSLIAFLTHILLITIQNNTDLSFTFLGGNGEKLSYLSAIATPFNFILIFEVFILIVSLPKNITTAVLRQYQIIGLVIIRNVFKDISHFDDISSLTQNAQSIQEVMLDMAGGFAIFVLIGFFLFLKRKFEKLDLAKDLNKSFRSIKIGITMVAIFAFFGFFATTIFGMNSEEFLSFVFVDFTQSNDFFTNLFTLLIVLDAIILVISYLYDDQFEFIMRDAFFIISTILIRIALTTPKPYDISFAIGGTIFGILGFLAFGIYNKAKYKDLSNVDFNNLLSK